MNRFLTCFIATHVSILTSDISTAPLGTASQIYGTLPYQSRIPKNSTIRSFGVDFEPRYIFGADLLDQ